MGLTDILILSGFGLNMLLTFAVYKWQSAQIAAQKGTIDAMKGTIESLKSYAAIFDLQQVKDFSAMKDELKDMKVAKQIESYELQIKEYEERIKILKHLQVAPTEAGILGTVKAIDMYRFLKVDRDKK